MRQETQIQLTKRVLAHIAAQGTDHSAAVTHHPVGLYTCPERAASERQTLFRNEAIVVAMSCDLRRPGDYVTDDNTGVPLLIVRGEDGRARAFINACQHRGARLAEGRGHAKRRFVCPYHAWSFAFDGRLAKLPHEEGFSGLDPDACGLQERPLAEKYGITWVQPEGDAAIDIDNHLEGLGPELGEFKLADYHHYETRRIDVKMNWKLVIDTFLEPYHFATLHRTTVGPIFLPNMCLFDAFGRNLRETFPRRTIAALAEKPEDQWDFVHHTALVYVLFPNTVVVMQADHLEIWRIFPSADAVDQSHMYLEFYIPEPVTNDKARAHWDANMDILVRTVLEEDFPTGEGAQAGFMSGSGRSHIVFGRNEPALAHFETVMAAALY